MLIAPLLHPAPTRFPMTLRPRAGYFGCFLIILLCGFSPRPLWGQVVPDSTQRVSLRPAGAIDVATADALVRQVFRERQTHRYDGASQIYLTLLELADGALNASDRALVERHIGQMAFLLPPGMRGQSLVEARKAAVMRQGRGGHLLAA